MDSLGKAVWYIETHFGSDLSLADVACAAGVSKFHLVRAFGTYTGLSVMRYVNGASLPFLKGPLQILSDGHPIDGVRGTHVDSLRREGELVIPRNLLRDLQVTEQVIQCWLERRDIAVDRDTLFHEP